MTADVKAFFDQTTNTVTYVVSDPATKVCAIIDPVLDFDPVSGRTSSSSIRGIIEFVADHGLEVAWILETHAHADHLSAAQKLKSATGGEICIGKLITDSQAIFKKIFNLGEGFSTDGSQFDRLFEDGEILALGALEIRVMHTPGHTPACLTYVIGDCAFSGDTLFMPDFGTARTDFPGGDAAVLYRSIQRIFKLPKETRLFMCHDYGAPGRDDYAWETTVAAQRADNIHIHTGISEQEFVEFRTNRDLQLGMPKLILPSIQVNIRAGEMPAAESNGVVYLKLPVDSL